MGSSATKGTKCTSPHTRRRTHKSSHARKHKLKPNDSLPPGVTTKELSCASCRIRKTRCSGDRPACAQCTKAAVAKGFPADGVRCVYSAASVFATKDDVDFEQKVGGRGARCVWDSSAPAAMTSTPAITTSTEVATAADPAPCPSPVEQPLEEQPGHSALPATASAADDIAVAMPEPANLYGSPFTPHEPTELEPRSPFPSTSFSPALLDFDILSPELELVAGPTTSASSSPIEFPSLYPSPEFDVLPIDLVAGPTSSAPPSPIDLHYISPPPPPSLLPPHSGPLLPPPPPPPIPTSFPPLHVCTRSNISGISLFQHHHHPAPPPPSIWPAAPPPPPTIRAPEPATPFLGGTWLSSPSPLSPSTPEDPLPSTADVAFWEWGPLSLGEVDAWPGLSYVATQSGITH